MSDAINHQRDAFARRLTDILNSGALNLAMGIGYRVRLFDVMDAMTAPATAAAIAGRAGLDTRYVTEWLGVMVCGGVVAHSRAEDGQDVYHLPEAHADLMTRRAGSANLGVYTQEIPLLTRCVLDEVIAGFRTGEGIGYHHYPRFQHFMGQLADAKHREVLVPIFLPSVEKGALVDRMKQGIRVCDLGCAEGVALMLMAQAYPRSAFVGLDISAEALQKARTAAETKGLNNVTFMHQDAAALAATSDLAGAFDYVTAFDAIHDQTQPLAALRGVHTLLKPGGAFSMVDIAAGSRLADNQDHPMGPFLYTVSLMHCMPVGLVNGGTGLGMMWGREKAVEMLAAAGFVSVEVTEIPQDAFNLHFFCRKSTS
ncbi:MAG: class I SAM-dependent methyltransferase [Desulfobacterales bacterium]